MTPSFRPYPRRSATLWRVALLPWALACGWAGAQTLNIASQGDAISLDPHAAVNESVQTSLTSNVYEPLVGRNKDLSLAPLLATSWKQTAPTVWSFALRASVAFQDGTPLVADDVVFSVERAVQAGLLPGVVGARVADGQTVEIETRQPQSLLPDALTETGIVSRDWATTHDPAKEANGTGPYAVRERVPGTRTVFERHGAYWGSIEGNVQRVVFTPLVNSSARIAGLLGGQLDLVEPVPVADAARINASGKARVVTGPELRTIFLGMEQQRDELQGASVQGRNPFKDRRVRQAVYQAIDINAITRTVQQGAARPAGLIVGPGINGWTAALDQRLSYDARGARVLLAEAGYPDGFALTLNCPGDRYVNDAQVCRAVAADLGKIGVKVQVVVESKQAYFPRLLRRDTGFYLLGWTPGTYDAAAALEALAQCHSDSGDAGSYNVGRYCNPALDALLQRVGRETDRTRRAALLGEALTLHAGDIGHVPLYQQALSWGVANHAEVVQLPDNRFVFKWMSKR